jgi:tetratricopeptide (TPR) repeat protein
VPWAGSWDGGKGPTPQDSHRGKTGFSERLPHFNPGALFERQGRLPEALAEYRIAAQLNPRDPETQHNLGSVFLQLGRDAGAESRFSDALQLRPGYVLARRALEHVRRMKVLEMPADANLRLRN